MKFAMEATIPESTLLGTKDLHSAITTRTRYIALAGDEAAVEDAIRIALGEYAAQGNFMFSSDPITDWFRKTSVHQGGFIQQYLDVIHSTQRLLGSVTLKSAVLAFVAEGLISFWVEAQEAEKVRVFAGETDAMQSTFDEIEPDWEFTPGNLARALISQF